MTWLELLREKLPDSMYAVQLGSVPWECPHTLLGEKAPGVNGRCWVRSMTALSCRECWNSEVKE